jgi:hypothetical protein
VQYAGTNYGQDISNELQNKTPVTLVDPLHMDDVVMRRGVREKMIRAGQLKIQLARKYQQTILQAAVAAGMDVDVDALMKLVILQNEIAKVEFAANIEVPVELTNSKKTEFSSEWRNYQEHNANLVNHKGPSFSLVQGQCTQLLQDKMKQDQDWITVSTSYDPLTYDYYHPTHIPPPL